MPIAMSIAGAAHSVIGRPHSRTMSIADAAITSRILQRFSELNLQRGCGASEDPFSELNLQRGCGASKDPAGEDPMIEQMLLKSLFGFRLPGGCLNAKVNSPYKKAACQQWSDLSDWHIKSPPQSVINTSSALTNEQSRQPSSKREPRSGSYLQRRSPERTPSTHDSVRRARAEDRSPARSLLSMVPLDTMIPKDHCRMLAEPGRFLQGGSGRLVCGGSTLVC